MALDSAAYNVEIIMQTRHARFYDQAFGNQPSNWKALSPICSSTPNFTGISGCLFHNWARPTMYTGTAIYSQAQKSGTKTQLLPIPLSHREIDQSLGQNNSIYPSGESFYSKPFRYGEMSLFQSHLI